MITESNYKQEIKRVVRYLPRHTRQKIMDKTGETYSTVCNVFSGRQYKKNVVDEINRRFKELKKELAT